MSNVSEGRTQRRVSIALAIILVLVVAAFSFYYYQSQTSIGRLQARGTFGQSVIMLPKTNITLPPCTRISCTSKNSWTWTFPQNSSALYPAELNVQYPGYLNVTIYYSNNTLGVLSARWFYDNGLGAGSQQWDYSAGSYPRTIPASTIIPVIKAMIGLTLYLYTNSIFTSVQTISISYHY